MIRKKVKYLGAAHAPHQTMGQYYAKLQLAINPVHINVTSKKLTPDTPMN